MSITPSLDAVKQQFIEWRASPNKSRQIPGCLWEQVVPLLKHYGISKILSTLGIKLTQLNSYRQRTDQRLVKSPSKNKPLTIPSFASISMPDNLADAVSLELIRPDGVTLCFKKIDQRTLTTLLHSFLG